MPSAIPFNKQNPLSRMAPGPTSWWRACPRRPRTALRPRRLSPPAMMTRTGARRPAPRASLQPWSPDSVPGLPPRPSSRRLWPKLGVEGGLKKVRGPSTRKVLRRLLARVSNHELRSRRGVAESSSSSLEATSDGSAELSEGGEGGCATNFWSLEGVLSPLSR